MKQWRRLFFYLILNILVSACTIFAVLFIWDQLYEPLPRGLLPQALSYLSNPPTATQPPTPVNIPAPQATPTETFVVYQVQSGDTFESIAEEFDLEVDELIAVNGFTQSQPLGDGEVLRVPTHTQGSVTIDSVVGPGDLETERVLLKHQGKGEISLVGWQLEDGKGLIFVFPQFPQLILYKGGAVNVYTSSGINTVVDLYWGLTSPVWSPGSTVILRDAAGSVHDTYTVP